MKGWEIGTAIAEIGFGVSMAVFTIGLVVRLIADGIGRDKNERVKAYRKWEAAEIDRRRKEKGQ